MTNSGPTISVVIPVYNARDTIAKCLDSLTRQDYSDYEVIIVDDGSTDQTAEIYESYEKVRVIRLNNGGPSKARNEGIKVARGEVVAFTDSDCVADRDWLKELAKGFINQDVAGVGGDQKSPHDESDFGRRVQEILKSLGVVTYYMKNDHMMGETEHNPSCNSAYRKSVLEEMGGFDEALWPGEDVDLDLRIRRQGYKLIYNPAALVGHYRPETCRGFARMMRRYGSSAWHLFKRHGLFRTLHYEPIATLLLMIFMMVMIIWEPWTWLVVLMPWPVFFLWFFVKSRQFIGSIQLTFLFMIILSNWNLGFFTGYWYRLRP